MNALQDYNNKLALQSNAQVAQSNTAGLMQQQQNVAYWNGYPYWGGTCPSCGYCKCCGRSNSSPRYPQPFTYGQCSQPTNMAPQALGLNSLPGFSLNAPTGNS